MAFSNYYQNKVAIVTGASSGVGHEISLLLAKKGAKVVLASRSISKIEQIVNNIKSQGHQAFAYPCDITQQGQINQLVEATLSHWGKVDILIANAGQYFRSPIKNIDPDIFEQSMAVNFYGHLYSVLAVLPHMLTEGSGHIVLISSMDAKTPMMLEGPYVAAKSALSGFGDVLRQELHDSGVTVSTIFPGRVDTPMIDNIKVPWISGMMSAQKAAQIIVKRMSHGRAHLIFPKRAHLLNLFNFISPALADWGRRTFHLQGWDRQRNKDCDK